MTEELKEAVELFELIANNHTDQAVLDSWSTIREHLPTIEVTAEPQERMSLDFALQVADDLNNGKCDEDTEVIYDVLERLAKEVRYRPRYPDFHGAHSMHYYVHSFDAMSVTIDWNLPYPLGCALKYLARYQHKGTPIKDLEKAESQIRWTIEWLKLNPGLVDALTFNATDECSGRTEEPPATTGR